ncbi:MAG: hypothetical protein M0T84_04295 [Betaproteobacteria bacterium]|nr:hypothetical protein [Betaproteobacteria bacterium]
MALHNRQFAVTRTLPLAPHAAETLDRALDKLRAATGIIEARLARPVSLVLRYDASAIGIREIETRLQEAGIACNATLGWRLKSAWYAFVDGNARSNAASTGGACCNRPPPTSKR